MARATERAYEAIRRGIVEGRHPGGAPLGEEVLAEEIGVSRTPVRDALRRLEAEGLVEFHPHRSARVASYSDRDVEEIFELRTLLESYAARLAATRIDRFDLEALHEGCERMEAATAGGSRDRLSRVAELNRVFHETIVNAAGNRRLAAQLAAVIQVPLVHQTFHRYSPAALARSFNHHRELVAALTARDPGWAESVMRSHILAARTVLMTPAGQAPPAAERDGS